MKRALLCLTLLCLTPPVLANYSSAGSKEDTKNQYFGETPPNLTPKLFEPKQLSPNGRFEGGTFTPDMQTFYFTRKNGKYKNRAFFVIHNKNSHWVDESETDIRWPEFSADGNVMYVGKQYRERTVTGWSEAKSPGEFINKMAHGRSVSANGTYYYTVYDEPDVGAIHFARNVNGKFEEPVKLSSAINTGTFIAHPYIAPDESYLIWDMRRKDSYGLADLYISFKQQDGTWLPAINMGSKINTDMQESSPRVTHDGKYLFFTRGEWKVKEDGTRYYVGKRYWVGSQVITSLRPKSISF